MTRHDSILSFEKRNQTQCGSKSIKGPIPAAATGSILGAAWGPQRDRMDAGIYFSLYIVLVNDLGRAGIFFLPRDLQTEEMFIARSPLSQTARRAGWQGFGIDLGKALAPAVRIEDGGATEFRVTQAARSRMAPPSTTGGLSV